MSRKYRLSTALDVDDLLMECTSYAIRLANDKYKFDPPMTIYEKDRWGLVGTRADAIYPYFSDADFYRTQPVYKGAKEFVRKLTQMTDVYICTAVPPEFMGIRAQRILEEFPEIPFLIPDPYLTPVRPESTISDQPISILPGRFFVPLNAICSRK